MSTPPPIGTWKKWYWLVAGFLVIQIMIYYIITKTYA
jgi:hypothetical protein